MSVNFLCNWGGGLDEKKAKRKAYQTAYYAANREKVLAISADYRSKKRSVRNFFQLNDAIAKLANAGKKTHTKKQVRPPGCTPMTSESTEN